MPESNRPLSPIRQKLHDIIFEAETPAGKVFDVVLLLLILGSVAAVCLESVESIRLAYGRKLKVLEWAVTVVFTIEYAVRLISVKNAGLYARSFFGIVDLIGFLPTYLGLLFSGAHSLIVFRSLRLLRVFRVLKLVRYIEEAGVLMAAIRASRAKITVFVGTVLTTVTILGTLMYLIEGPAQGFTSIPVAMYWAIVTMTTVGYGDLAPGTPFGQLVASAIMILGYGLIAVPTGIVSVELAHASKLKISTHACENCSREGHDVDAVYCRYCGHKLYK